LAGAFYTGTTTGATKRIVVYGKTYDEARDKLAKAQQQARAGIPVPDNAWTLGPYLDYWLENHVKRNRRPATYALYETYVRLYLKPGLGTKKLASLSVPMVQQFLNGRLGKGDSVRKVQVLRTVLSAALTRAVREELLIRNVARLVELPEWQAGAIRPWTAGEARQFLAASESDPLHAAFVLLTLYGLRRGEVLGLRWTDIDFSGGVVHVSHQLQRVRGQLHRGPVKTRAGQRNLPLVNIAEQALQAEIARQARYRDDMGSAWPDTDLIFTTRTGRPVEPRNLVRSFRRLCNDNGIRAIKLHHIRHTVAPLLKDLGVPARDTQLILGHSQLAVTLEVYTHADDDAKLEALMRLHGLLGEAQQ
jgi:integrase